ncbi:MAG: cell division FtsZ family protein [Opitutaceae bacterium]|jgi:cell division protein FtsZ|nr:cell division FtsZ family protein [Opitutaceae bacterium]
MDSTELPLSTPPSPDAPPVTLKLIGIGGGGSNALARLAHAPLDGLATAIIDTDRKALDRHDADAPHLEKHLLAPALRRGLSTGGDPDLGRETAEASREQLAPIATGADILFLAVSLGGGAGGGIAPVIAELATETNALVIAFATLPFSFEGPRRARQAGESLLELRRACDAVITLPNDLLLQQTDDTESATDALRRADEWMLRGVCSIHSILRRPNLINLDLAALRRAFVTRGGKTLYALGSGSGGNVVAQTLETLRMCPLLHIPEAARKVDHLIVNIIAGSSITLPVINELMREITAHYARDAHVLMGTSITHDHPDAIQICLLGTTDMGARATSSRRPSKTAVAPPEQTENKKPPVQNGSLKPSQDEFTFASADQQRGTFENSDRNLFEDQDLDRPTYLRRGIKIQL